MDFLTLVGQFFLGVFAILLPFGVITGVLLVVDRLLVKHMEPDDFDPLDKQIEAENKANPLSKNFVHDCID